MGTSRCSTWTTSTSGMVGAFALEPPEQPAVPNAKTRETVTAQVATFDIVFSPFVADSGGRQVFAMRGSLGRATDRIAGLAERRAASLPTPGEAPVMMTTGFSDLRLIDMRSPLLVRRWLTNRSRRQRSSALRQPRDAPSEPFGSP